jgi:hypothetical protein
VSGWPRWRRNPAPIRSLCDETTRNEELPDAEAEQLAALYAERQQPKARELMGRYELGRSHTIEQSPARTSPGAEMYDPDYLLAETERERDYEASVNAELRARITELEAQLRAAHRELDERGAPRMAMRADETLIMPRTRSMPAPGRPEANRGR